MKKGYLIPITTLAVILAGVCWINTVISSKTDLWKADLQKADLLAQEENWRDAAETVSSSYADWTFHQAWLRIATRHDIVDAAEAMYHRAMAFAHTQELSEFRAEIADLLTQLCLLAEIEQFSIQNIF